MDRSAFPEKMDRDEVLLETEEKEGVAENDTRCEAICILVRDDECPFLSSDTFQSNEYNTNVYI